MDDWEKLDVLHKKYDILKSSVEKSKRKLKKETELAEYVENTKQELSDKYLAVSKYLEDHPDEVVDDETFGKFLYNVTEYREFRNYLYERYNENGSYEASYTYKPEYRDFIDMYGGKREYGFVNGYGFQYILDTIDSMKESINDYSLFDSLGDTLTIPTGLGAGLGAVGAVALNYGLTMHRYKKQGDQLRYAIDALEDKLYWNK